MVEAFVKDQTISDAVRDMRPGIHPKFGHFITTYPTDRKKAGTKKRSRNIRNLLIKMERAMGLEPTTSSLGS
jgi:hypothetical protein